MMDVYVYIIIYILYTPCHFTVMHGVLGPTVKLRFVFSPWSPTGGRQFH